MSTLTKNRAGLENHNPVGRRGRAVFAQGKIHAVPSVSYTHLKQTNRIPFSSSCPLDSIASSIRQYMTFAVLLTGNPVNALGKGIQGGNDVSVSYTHLLGQRYFQLCDFAEKRFLLLLQLLLGAVLIIRVLGKVGTGFLKPGNLRVFRCV